MRTTTNFTEAETTEDYFSSTVKETVVGETATAPSSPQQKNWTILGDMRTTTNFTEAETTEDYFSSTVKETVVGETATAPSSPQQNNWTILGAADCFWKTSLDYSGTISYTVSGIPCQYWNTNSPHQTYYQPVDTTAMDTNYCRETNYNEGGPGCYTTNATVMWEYCYIVKCDACGVDERFPVIPFGTTPHFHVDKFIGMVFTCDTLTPGTSVDHCPVAQCGADDQWTEYSTSCTPTFQQRLHTE
ncbi:PLG [Mytilus edulis]|uniref:PLG n=1 Tax=Mytilus edulis TaxID=6550 RepID=A0A8S3R9L9_MYTED|nr:PLG [Mytilus edulis]